MKSYAMIPLALLSELNGNEIKVLTVFFAFDNVEKGCSWPSRERVAQLTDMHPNSVSRITKGLVDRGYITKQRWGFTNQIRYQISKKHQIKIATPKVKKSNATVTTGSNATVTRCNATVTTGSNATVTTGSNASVTTKDKTNDKTKNTRVKKVFSPPTISEVSELYKSKTGRCGKNFADRFCNHYEMVGWKVGKNKMQSWRHAVSRWIADDNNRKNKKTERGELIL